MKTLKLKKDVVEQLTSNQSKNVMGGVPIATISPCAIGDLKTRVAMTCEGACTSLNPKWACLTHDAECGIKI